MCGNTTPEGRSVFTEFRVFPISTSVDITVYQHGKNVLYFFYNIVQRNIKYNISLLILRSGGKFSVLTLSCKNFRLQKLQNRAARVIMNFSNISGPEAIKALGWENLETRRAKSKAKTMYKVLNNLAPSSLEELFERKRNITKYDLRGSSTSLQLPQPKTEKLKKTFLTMELNFGTLYLWICVIRIHCQYLKKEFVLIPTKLFQT